MSYDLSTYPQEFYLTVAIALLTVVIALYGLSNYQKHNKSSKKKR